MEVKLKTQMKAISRLSPSILDNYVTKEELEDKHYLDSSGLDEVLAHYVTKDELVEELVDYVTEEELDAKHYIDENELSNALSDYATVNSVTELDNRKQDKLDFDNTPTLGSNNPVTSNGIKVALDNKQDTIDSSHKLSADLVDDTNTTNKFVTAGEKATWSAKQNAIDSSHKLSADLIEDGETNKVFTATEQSKLTGIESGAQVNTVNSVNGKTGAVVLNADDISDAETINKFVTTSEKDYWNAKVDASTIDQAFFNNLF